jgi:transcriptional/translational regulatory protein YebC/TACO1
MFDHLAIFVFKYDDEDAVLEALMDADVDVTDIENEDGKLSVFASNTDYFKAKQALLDSCGEIDLEVDEIQFIAHNYMSVSGYDVALFEKFLAMLDELDDVQQVYHNVELT